MLTLFDNEKIDNKYRTEVKHLEDSSLLLSQAKYSWDQLQKAHMIEA